LGTASECARVRKQLEACCVNIFDQYTISASHKVISSKFRRLDIVYNRLSKMVGEEEATEILVSSYDKVSRDLL
jgi:hypothetical protein